MKKTLLVGLIASFTAGVAHADFSISSDLTFASEYVFRGIKYGDMSLQPSVEFTDEGFYAGLWVQQPLEKRSSRGWGDEIDLYLGFTPKLSDSTSLDIGATHYYYPNGEATTEIFVGANFTAGGFTPGIYAYYDIDAGGGTVTLQGNLGFSIPLDQLGTSLDLSASVGNVSPDEGESYVYYSVGVALPYKLNENATFKVGVNWASHDLDGVDDNHVWFTAGLTVGF